MSLPPQKKYKKKNSKNKKEEINLEIEIKNSIQKYLLKMKKNFHLQNQKN
jgi:hypothetical protein